jgi:FixJ family two-component response regulator
MTFSELSPKEQELLRAVVREKATSRKELSAMLHVAERTVAHHIDCIGKKTGKSRLLEIILELYSLEEK